jgi:hypothetical protein
VALWVLGLIAAGLTSSPPTPSASAHSAGKDMHAVSQYLTVAEYAGILSATLNLKIVPEHHSLYAFFTNTTLDREWWLHMLAMVNG